MAAMYAIYHGPAGLKRIATRVHNLTTAFKNELEAYGYKVITESFFDTVTIDVQNVEGRAARVVADAEESSINLRIIDQNTVGVTFDESIGLDDLAKVINVFASSVNTPGLTAKDIDFNMDVHIPRHLLRTSETLPHPVFNKHHSETQMMRYLYHLQSKDLSLVHAMIPLGSCTMKLNSTSSMLPLTWPEFSEIHPFAPVSQAEGFKQIIKASAP